MTEVQDLHESTREDAEAASTTAWLNQVSFYPKRFTIPRSQIVEIESIFITI